MRHVFLLCGLSLIAAGARAEDAPPRTTAGIRVGVGSIGMPGFHSGPPVADFAVGVERVVLRTDSIVAGIVYQPVCCVSYLDDPSGATYRGRLASTFIGYKSRVAGDRSGAYVGANIGVTRWSGRPDDVRFTPSLGALVGADLAVQSRSKVFAEIGTRFGKPDTVAPHWSFGLGYAVGF
jgi:hypothetical protein